MFRFIKDIKFDKIDSKILTTKKDTDRNNDREGKNKKTKTITLSV
jgi:hypothetical protein